MAEHENPDYIRPTREERLTTPGGDSPETTGRQKRPPDVVPETRPFRQSQPSASVVPGAQAAVLPPLLNESPVLTPLHYLIFAVAFAGWMFDFYDLFLYTFMLRQIAPDLGLTRVNAGYALGASLAATAVGGVFFGVLADRIGRKPVLILTILTFSVGTALCAFAYQFWDLLLFRVITGLGIGGEWATGHAIVAESFPAHTRGRAGAFIQTGAPLGLALAAAVGGFLEPSIGWRHCFLVSVIPALALAFVIWRWVPESDMWQRMRDCPDCPREFEINAPAGIEGGQLPALDRSVMIAERQEGIGSLFFGRHRYMFFLALVLAMLDLSAYWFTYSWLPEYLQAERGLAVARSATWVLLMQLGGFVGYATFGIMADRIGRRPAYTIYGILWAVGLLMMTLLWNAVGGSPAVILTCMIIVGIGTGMFGGYGPLFAEIFPTHIRNSAMGAAFNLARGVQFFTPVIIALIAAHWGLAGGISLAAFFAFATGLWVWLFPETKGRRLQELEPTPTHTT